jgi:hypothetical protein
VSAHGDEPLHQTNEQTEDDEWWTAEDQEFAKSAARRASSIKPADIDAAAARATSAEDHLRSDPWRGALASIPKTYALDAYASSLGTTMLEAYSAALPKGVPGLNLAALGMLEAYSAALPKSVPGLNALGTTMLEAYSAALPKSVPGLNALGTTMLEAYGAALRENNRSVFESLAGLRYTTHFAKATESTRASLANLAAAVHGRYLPPNVARCTSPNINDAFAIAEDEGIALFLVPGPEVVALLLDAPDAEARRAVLDERAVVILKDCETLLDTCIAPEVVPFVPYARKALNAARDGHYEAAQALAANTLDSMSGAATSLYPVQPQFKNPEVIRGAPRPHTLVLWPAWHSHQQFRTNRGDKIPSTFSRHGSVHAVGEVQYTKTNAVQGLLLLVSMIGFVHERARRTSL